MTTEERKKASLDFAMIYESLVKSMNEAGGLVHSVSGLLSMSAFDLLCELAPNNIFFRYVTPTTGKVTILEDPEAKYHFRQGTKE